MMDRKKLIVTLIILAATVLSIWMAVRMGNIANKGGETMDKTEAIIYTIIFALISVALILAIIMLWYEGRKVSAISAFRSRLK